MAKTVDIELTKVEIQFLHDLVQDNMDCGIYYGNKNWFLTMQNKIYEKLADACSELEGEV